MGQTPSDAQATITRVSLATAAANTVLNKDIRGSRLLPALGSLFSLRQMRQMRNLTRVPTFHQGGRDGIQIALLEHADMQRDKLVRTR